MNKEAIQQIQQTQTTETLNQLETMKGSNSPIIALPHGFEIEDLERYQENRTRYRGTYKTSLLDHFVKYIEDHSVGNEPCFVNADNMSAQHFFNLGDYAEPGHGDHTANLKLITTSVYQALLRVDNQTFSQKDLADWLSDWRDMLSPTNGDGATYGDMQSAINAVRRLTITEKIESDHTADNFSANRSALEEIEASSKGTQLPAGFEFKFIPYEGFAENTAQLRLSLNTNHEKPRLTLRIVRLEKLQEEIANQFRNALESGLGEQDITVNIGSFNP